MVTMGSLLRVAMRHAAVECALTWVVLCPTPARSSDADLKLEMALHLEGRSVEAGTPIRLRILYSNSGKNPLFVRRRTDIGKGEIEITATDDACSAAVPMRHVDYVEGTDRFFYVPLWPGRALEESVFLNDPDAADFLELPLIRPGRYSLRVRYAPDSPLEVGVLWPVWSGEAQSNAASLEISPARPAAIAQWRARLRSCLDERCEPGFAAGRYFRLVRDNEAADILLRLLDRYPGDYSLVEALSAQGRAQDARTIRQLERRPEYGPLMHTRLDELARRLEQPGGCW
jgi:hypothetical protein